MSATELTHPGPAASLGTWQSLPAAQQPDWPDPVRYRRVLADLESYPPLSFASESNQLRARLAEIAEGRGFLLQGGDCAERFDHLTGERVGGTVRTILQMALVLSYASSLPVTPVGRIAGQYAKPRSSPTETRGDLTLPVYRGDGVNGIDFTVESRTPDPERLRQAYHASATTLNFVRGFVSSEENDVWSLHEANRAFVAHSPRGDRHQRLLTEIESTLAFVVGLGGEMSFNPTFYSSHEALLLDYETALTRQDPLTGRHYGTSAHMLWLGERTRQLDGAHVEFAAQIGNPIGVKLGPTVTSAELRALIERLDPARVPGRLSLITRMGAGHIREVLPELVETVRSLGAQPIWVCDPMHGNTITTDRGYKTRRVEDILDEISGFFEVHRALGTHPGGIHLELTGENVTECIEADTPPHHIATCYDTACDPRLNRLQSLDIAFQVAEIIRG